MATIIPLPHRRAQAQTPQDIIEQDSFRVPVLAYRSFIAWASLEHAHAMDEGDMERAVQTARRVRIARVMLRAAERRLAEVGLALE